MSLLLFALAVSPASSLSAGVLPVRGGQQPAVAMMARKVLYADEAREALMAGVNKVADAVKVTDFGISTRFAQDHTAETGTYRYMAPEVIAHQKYDYRCDVYSYGMLMWEITHREIPFRSQNALQAAFAVAMEQKRPRSEEHTSELQSP